MRGCSGWVGTRAPEFQAWEEIDNNVVLQDWRWTDGGKMAGRVERNFLFVLFFSRAGDGSWALVYARKELFN